MAILCENLFMDFEGYQGIAAGWLCSLVGVPDGAAEVRVGHGSRRGLCASLADVGGRAGVSVHLWGSERPVGPHVNSGVG